MPHVQDQQNPDNGKYKISNGQDSSTYKLQRKKKDGGGTCCLNIY